MESCGWCCFTGRCRRAARVRGPSPLGVRLIVAEGSSTCSGRSGASGAGKLRDTHRVWIAKQPSWRAVGARARPDTGFFSHLYVAGFWCFPGAFCVSHVRDTCLATGLGRPLVLGAKLDTLADWFCRLLFEPCGRLLTAARASPSAHERRQQTHFPCFFSRQATASCWCSRHFACFALQVAICLSARPLLVEHPAGAHPAGRLCVVFARSHFTPTGANRLCLTGCALFPGPLGT